MKNWVPALTLVNELQLILLIGKSYVWSHRMYIPSKCCYKVVEFHILVVPTTCYRPAIQQVMSDNLVAVDKLATSLLRTHPVDKL